MVEQQVVVETVFLFSGSRDRNFFWGVPWAPNPTESGSGRPCLGLGPSRFRNWKEKKNPSLLSTHPVLFLSASQLIPPSPLCLPVDRVTHEEKLNAKYWRGGGLFSDWILTLSTPPHTHPHSLTGGRIGKKNCDTLLNFPGMQLPSLLSSPRPQRRVAHSLPSPSPSPCPSPFSSPPVGLLRSTGCASATSCTSAQIAPLLSVQGVHQKLNHHSFIFLAKHEFKFKWLWKFRIFCFWRDYFSLCQIKNFIVRTPK